MCMYEVKVQANLGERTNAEQRKVGKWGDMGKTYSTYIIYMYENENVVI